MDKKELMHLYKLHVHFLTQKLALLCFPRFNFFSKLN